MPKLNELIVNSLFEEHFSLFNSIKTHPVAGEVYNKTITRHINALQTYLNGMKKFIRDYEKPEELSYDVIESHIDRVRDKISDLVSAVKEDGKYNVFFAEENTIEDVERDDPNNINLFFYKIEEAAKEYDAGIKAMLRQIKQKTKAEKQDGPLYFPDEKFYQGKIDSYSSYDFKEVDDLYPGGGPKMSDIVQDQMLACYILAPLATIADKKPEIIKDMIHDNGDGTVTVKFYGLEDDLNEMGKDKKSPLEIRVNKTVPNMDKRSAPWVQIIEKAYAASNLTASNGMISVHTDVPDGSIQMHKVLNGGNPSLFMQNITPAKADEKPAEAMNRILSFNSSQGVYRSFVLTLSSAIHNNDAVYLNTSEHVLVLKDIRMSNGEIVLDVYDQAEKKKDFSVSLNNLFRPGVTVFNKPLESINICSFDGKIVNDIQNLYFNEIKNKFVKCQDAKRFNATEEEISKLDNWAKESPVKQTVIEPNVEPAKEAAPELVKEMVLEPAKEEAVEEVKEVVQEPIKEEVAEEVVPEPVKEEVVEEVVPEPVKEVVPEPVKEVVEEPMNAIVFENDDDNADNFIADDEDIEIDVVPVANKIDLKEFYDRMQLHFVDSKVCKLLSDSDDGYEKTVNEIKENAAQAVEAINKGNFTDEVYEDSMEVLSMLLSRIDIKTSETKFAGLDGLDKNEFDKYKEAVSDAGSNITAKREKLEKDFDIVLGQAKEEEPQDNADVVEEDQKEEKAVEEDKEANDGFVEEPGVEYIKHTKLYKKKIEDLDSRLDGLKDYLDKMNTDNPDYKSEVKNMFFEYMAFKTTRNLIKKIGNRKLSEQSLDILNDNRNKEYSYNSDYEEDAEVKKLFENVFRFSKFNPKAEDFDNAYEKNPDLFKLEELPEENIDKKNGPIKDYKEYKYNSQLIKEEMHEMAFRFKFQRREKVKEGDIPDFVEWAVKYASGQAVCDELESLGNQKLGVASIDAMYEIVDKQDDIKSEMLSNDAFVTSIMNSVKNGTFKCANALTMYQNIKNPPQKAEDINTNEQKAEDINTNVQKAEDINTNAQKAEDINTNGKINAQEAPQGNEINPGAKAANEDPAAANNYSTKHQFDDILDKLKRRKTFKNSEEYEGVINLVDFANRYDNWDSGKHLTPQQRYVSKLLSIKSSINKYINHKAKFGVKQNVFKKLAAIEELNKMVEERLNAVKFDPFTYANTLVKRENYPLSYQEELNDAKFKKIRGDKYKPLTPMNLEKANEIKAAVIGRYPKVKAEDIMNANGCMARIVLSAMNHRTVTDEDVDKLREMEREFKIHPHTKKVTRGMENEHEAVEDEPEVAENEIKVAEKENPELNL